MLVRFSDIKLNDAVTFGQTSSRHVNAIERLLHQAKGKTPSLQLYRKIKAIIIKILCNINLFIQDTHFIDANTLTQTTYYKTLTSRP